MSEAVLYETRGPAAWITLNRPEKLNALNGAVLEGLNAALDRAAADDEVKVVVLKGAGERAFSAGYDLSAEAAHADIPAHEWHGVLATDVDATMKLWALPKPTIAAVHGYCLAGGCELAMACTLRIASENARFGQPEVKLGIIPGYAGTQRLPRLVGKGRAHEMILSGEPIDAQEACRIGLANRVVPLKDLIAAAEALARKVMANGPLAVQFAMEAVNHGMEMSEAQGEFLEATLFGLCCTTADMREGTRAFLEKRPPKFVGK